MKNIILAVALINSVLLAIMIGQQASAQTGYEATIYDACDPSDGDGYNCDAATLIRVAQCESGGDPSAWHANPYGGADVGLYQINDATWGDEIAYAGPEAQVWWAAEKFATGQGPALWWPSQWCWG